MKSKLSGVEVWEGEYLKGGRVGEGKYERGRFECLK